MGIPGYDGTPELLDEYPGRVETLHTQYTELVQKKQGPVVTRLFTVLPGDAFTAVAAKAANIKESRKRT